MKVAVESRDHPLVFTSFLRHNFLSKLLFFNISSPTVRQHDLVQPDVRQREKTLHVTFFGQIIFI